MNLQQLSLGDVGIAALLIVLNGAVSLALSLGLGRQLALASVRTVVQLLAIGYVLGWVFGHPHWYVVLPLATLMTVIAGMAGAARGKRSYAGQRVDSLLSVWLSGWLVTSVGLFVVIRVHPWYTPQYTVPILGMILGNTLTGVALGMERMSEELVAHRDWVETVLALGGSRWEAARDAARAAVRAGMLPTLNQMAVVGVVSLPGMMTGQVLAGQSPLQAVRYQIVIMFLIAAASSLGTVGAVLLSFRRLFSADHVFLSARLIERSRKRKAKPKDKRN
jgi:putative ABC transport system permease protein